MKHRPVNNGDTIAQYGAIYDATILLQNNSTEKIDKISKFITEEALEDLKSESFGGFPTDDAYIDGVIEEVAEESKMLYICIFLQFKTSRSSIPMI